MLSCMLALPLDVAQGLDQYASEQSTSVSSDLICHHEWTRSKFADADRSSSLLQAQWMAQRAHELRAKRVLDIGCYTGLSALAWYIGTKGTNAQIYTIEKDAEIAATAKKAFKERGCEDRIHVIEGAAQTILGQLSEPFDIIFVDLEFSAYLPVVQQVLDRHLLAQSGVMLVDNVFARGFVVDSKNHANIDPQLVSHWVEAGRLVREFNSFVAADTRVTVTVLPFFDGISDIRLRC